MKPFISSTLVLLYFLSASTFGGDWESLDQTTQEVLDAKKAIQALEEDTNSGNEKEIQKEKLKTHIKEAEAKLVERRRRFAEGKELPDDWKLSESENKSAVRLAQAAVKARESKDEESKDGESKGDPAPFEDAVRELLASLSSENKKRILEDSSLPEKFGMDKDQVKTLKIIGEAKKANIKQLKQMTKSAVNLEARLALEEFRLRVAKYIPNKTGFFESKNNDQNAWKSLELREALSQPGKLDQKAVIAEIAKGLGSISQKQKQDRMNGIISELDKLEKKGQGMSKEEASQHRFLSYQLAATRQALNLPIESGESNFFKDYFNPKDFQRDFAAAQKEVSTWQKEWNTNLDRARAGDEKAAQWLRNLQRFKSDDGRQEIAAFAKGMADGGDKQRAADIMKIFFGNSFHMVRRASEMGEAHTPGPLKNGRGESVPSFEKKPGAGFTVKATSTSMGFDFLLNNDFTNQFIVKEKNVLPDEEADFLLMSDSKGESAAFTKEDIKGNQNLLYDFTAEMRKNLLVESLRVQERKKVQVQELSQPRARLINTLGKR
jgi:hypothetical protein